MIKNKNQWNSSIHVICVVKDEKVPVLLETVQKLDARNPEVGVKAFSWTINQMV